MKTNIRWTATYIRDPGTNNSDPRTDISDPGTNNSDPRTNISDPGTNNSDLRTNISDPGTNNSHPRTNISDPGTNIWMRNALIFVHKLLVSDPPNISGLRPRAGHQKFATR